jgi:hypothetical protein
VIGQGHGAGVGALAATQVTVVSPTEITAVTAGGARGGNDNLFVIDPDNTASSVAAGDRFTYKR